MSLVTFHNNVPSISHRVVAEHTDMQEKSVSRIIQNHITDFEEFGMVAFQTHTLQTKGGKQEAKTYLLNEQQATLLLTYLKNVPIVRAFKKELIREFYRLKEQTTRDPMHLIAQTLETLASQQAMMMMQLFTQRTSPLDVFPHVDKPVSRMALQRLSNEEKFIAKIRKVLKECDGLSQGDLLRAARMALQRLSNEEKFIAKIRKVLKECDGLSQGDLLRAAGRTKCDRTALHWLYGYDGIYWRANVVSTQPRTYSYSIIEEA